MSHEVIATTSPLPNPAHLATKDVFTIPPGQFAILYSNEEVDIPHDVLAFISVKASVKFEGLVNISGFHVDPGYKGRLKFSVYNAGGHTIFLPYGAPTFLIWFADFDQAVRDPYNGGHKHQMGITSHDRQRMERAVASPAVLDQRISILEERWKNLMFAAKYVLLPLITAILAGLVIWVLTIALPLQAGSNSGPPSGKNATPTAPPIKQQSPRP